MSQDLRIRLARKLRSVGAFVQKKPDLKIEKMTGQAVNPWEITGTLRSPWYHVKTYLRVLLRQQF